MYKFISVFDLSLSLSLSLSLDSIESTGALSADTLVLEALRILINKCTHFLSELDDITCGN